MMSGMKDQDLNPVFIVTSEGSGYADKIPRI
jgi:hypothetical protein